MNQRRSRGLWGNPRDQPGKETPPQQLTGGRPGQALAFAFITGVWFHPWVRMSLRSNFWERGWSPLAKVKCFGHLFEGGMKHPSLRWEATLLNTTSSVKVFCIFDIALPEVLTTPPLLSWLKPYEEPLLFPADRYSQSLKRILPLGLKQAKMPGTWFYSLNNCICLGFGERYGFSAFAHDESRDTEPDLSNTP